MSGRPSYPYPGLNLLESHKCSEGFSNLARIPSWQFNFFLFQEKEHPEKTLRGLHSFPHLREEKFPGQRREKKIPSHNCRSSSWETGLSVHSHKKHFKSALDTPPPTFVLEASLLCLYLAHLSEIMESS